MKKEPPSPEQGHRHRWGQEKLGTQEKIMLEKGVAELLKRNPGSVQGLSVHIGNPQSAKKIYCFVSVSCRHCLTLIQKFIDLAPTKDFDVTLIIKDDGPATISRVQAMIALGKQNLFAQGFASLKGAKNLPNDAAGWANLFKDIKEFNGDKFAQDFNGGQTTDEVTKMNNAIQQFKFNAFPMTIYRGKKDFELIEGAPDDKNMETIFQ